jgi:deoxycytidylate deaminase
MLTQRKKLQSKKVTFEGRLFHGGCFLSAKGSKDPATPTGACIVDKQFCVIGIGYDGFPRCCPNDALPWACALNTSNSNWLHTPNPMCL